MTDCSHFLAPFTFFDNSQDPHRTTSDQYYVDGGSFSAYQWHLYHSGVCVCVSNITSHWTENSPEIQKIPSQPCPVASNWAQMKDSRMTNAKWAVINNISPERWTSWLDVSEYIVHTVISLSLSHTCPILFATITSSIISSRFWEFWEDVDFGPAQSKKKHL